MTFYVENETDRQLPFAAEEVVRQVAEAALNMESCPYETEVSVLFTDYAGIRVFNKEYRKIDKDTDVLSFPNVDYKEPADYTGLEEQSADYFHPDSGELILGDIILCLDRVYEQAELYGHSVLREFAFLIAHSMLHLLGYDHELPEEAEVMEAKQENILKLVGISRE